MADPAEPETEWVPGLWFDGQSSRGLPVLCRLRASSQGPWLILQPLQADRSEAEFAPQQIDWPVDSSEGSGPLQIGLVGAGMLQVSERQRWLAAARAAGWQPGWLRRLEQRWLSVLVLGVFSVGLLGFMLRWSTPWLAGYLTRYVPLSWEQSISREALASQDRFLLRPSRLPPERQAQLRAAFMDLAGAVPSRFQVYPGYQPALNLAFRRAGSPNAFAFPGGQMVMTDELVELARRQGLDDDALLGVLAHEMGHVWYRHTTRMVVEQGVLNTALALALGDLSTLASSGASLTSLAYERGHEEQADCFAIRVMQSANRPLTPMADLLQSLESGPPADPKAAQEPAWGDFLSTHPATAQRVQRLRQGRTEGCS